MQERKVLSQIYRITCSAIFAFAVSANVAAQTLSESLSPTTNGLSKPVEALTVHEIVTALAPAKSIDLTETQDNLWDRMRNGFAMPNLNDDLSLSYQQWYMNRPDGLRRMIDRSRPFLFHIMEEIEKRGMPTELALLPMVESAFNPMAYSHAHAAGLWQFIPSTGKRFNLEQDWWKDERRDVVASTFAALDYLQTIYDINGDWHLALASYNWGEGAVQRAMEKNIAKGLSADYASLKMPSETRNYVPKLQALKNIFGNPALMAQLNLPSIPNKAYFATFDTTRPIDVKTAAKLAEMPIDQFIALNPSHKRPVIQAETTVVLPAEKLEIFRNNLENHDEPLTNWEAYTLKRGEQPNTVAPRFGIPLAELLRANNLNPRVRLGAGTTLLVPAGNGGVSISSLENAPTEPKMVVIEPIQKKSRSKSSSSKRSKTKSSSHSSSKSKKSSTSKKSKKR